MGSSALIPLSLTPLKLRLHFLANPMGLGYQGSGGPTVDIAVISGVASTNFYIGVLGLNPQPTTFTDLNDPQPGLVTLLHQAGFLISDLWITSRLIALLITLID